MHCDLTLLTDCVVYRSQEQFKTKETICHQTEVRTGADETIKGCERKKVFQNVLVVVIINGACAKDNGLIPELALKKVLEHERGWII